MAAATATPPPPPSQPAAYSRWMPSLPTITLTQLNPFAGGDDTLKPGEPGSNAKTSTDTKRPFLSTLTSFASSASDNPPSPAASTADDVMFAEPDTRSNSEADSREGSVVGGEKRRKSNKPKTRFSICHPPPTSSARQKLHRRPRSLLQLHKLQSSARPLPAFEVVPSANFSVTITRAVTRMFKAKHSLCPNDIVVMRAEKYIANEEDEEQQARDVIGLICKGRKDEAAFQGGKAKLCLATGTEWEAYPLANGGYEFFSTDEHGLGLTVRWVPKRNKSGSKPKDKKFNFSTISPNSRRHPIIATLSKTSLEINDTYRMPDPSAATPLSTPKATPKVGGESALQEALDDEADEQDQRETDGLLRELITMTSIWVTFKEGWSPSFKYDEKDSVSASAANSIARSASLGISNSPSKCSASPLTTPPGSPSQQPLEKRNSMKSISSSLFRRSSVVSKGNRASQASLPEEDTADSTTTTNLRRSESSRKSATRSRSESTSTVLVHRAASNRRKNNSHHAATWRPDLLDAQHPLNETTREHLTRTPSPLPQSGQENSNIWDSPAAMSRAGQRSKEPYAQPLIPATADDEANDDSDSDDDNEADTTTTQAAASPPAPRTTTTTAAAASPKPLHAPKSHTSFFQQKRQSSAATTDTSASDAVSAGKHDGKTRTVMGAGGKGKGTMGARKRSGWRRLWCGHDGRE
ncbi:hypothetical protein B0A50_00003 [Salinomyces thailandicus]|uniref:Uncharacterized protein n=1 Tax=Salinomyces thailandicus TaxID=706561 RepID=A0A4U0UES2_9PEZI|nr:hypothetical protein B0A50_00003 [Salinomyces thailandica]